MYGMEGQIAHQKQTELHGEARAARLDGLARNGVGSSLIRAFLTTALHTDHTREKEA